MPTVKLQSVNTRRTIAKSSTIAQGETNDCVVIAIAAAADIPYEEAHALVAEKLNRVGRQGVKTKKIHEGFTEGTLIGSKRIVEVTQPVTRYKLYGELIARKMRLSSFVKQHPAGTYFVLIRGHALAVKEGVIHDNTSFPKSASLVNHAFKIE